MNRSTLISNVLIVFLLQLVELNAQPADPNPALRNYFRNPMGIPMKLSANFGELRPDHWHMGLDIRTNARENLPVYAAAQGHISHVGVRSNGYGRFIIIKHPNGTSTLYAHLNDFFPELEEYVVEKQYEKESWAIELDFSPQEFPLHKGDFIANSGNTGGSLGPHLHFEIIETETQKRLNPLLFNFSLKDYVRPVIKKLAIYDRSKSIYAQTPLLYSLKYTDSGYIIPKMPVIKTGMDKISFAIQATDRIESGWSEDGIYAAKLFENDDPVVGFVLDSIGYEDRVYMNAHIDYRYDHKGGPYLQLLTDLPGNRGGVYKYYSGDGTVSLSDTLVHHFKIEVKDPQGNTSKLHFAMQHFDSLLSNTGTHWPVKLAPGKAVNLEKPGFRMKLNEKNLYDTVPAYYSKSSSPFAFNAITSVHTLNDPSFPLHGQVSVSIRAEKEIPDDWKNRLVMQRSSRSSQIRKAEFKNGWITADFGDFGSYQVFADLTAPTINSPGKGDTINLSGAKSIVFTPADNFNVIRNFRVELNGEWLRFTNDKSRNWIYRFDDKFPYGVHELTATATDLAGNTTVKSWWVKRSPYTPPPPRKKTTQKKSSPKKRN